MEINKFCIVVPVYEKKENFLNFFENAKKLIKANEKFEIVIVNDGNDYSFDNLADWSDNKFHLVNNRKNLGYGASIKKGVLETNAEILAIIDADNSYDIEQLIGLMKNFENDECDLIVGKRIFKYKDSILKIVFRKLINKLSSIIFSFKVEDINSGLRVFYREDFLKDIKIFPDQFSLSSTQTLCTISRNKEIKYINTDYSKREGKSKISVLIDPFKFFYLIFKIFLIFSPMKFFGYIGIFFISLSLMILLFSFLFLDNILDLSFLILFISGINFIFFGLIGEIIRINNKN